MRCSLRIRSILIFTRDKAELLRNEEKKLRQDIKSIQLKILEKRNAVNLVKATQDFLLKLRSNPNTQQMDYLIKTFMRIIFKGIYIQNQEIVKVDINQPWKICYDEALKDRHGKEGVKCQKKRETTPKRVKRAVSRGTESVYFCVPSADRWCQLYPPSASSFRAWLRGTGRPISQALRDIYFDI